MKVIRRHYERPMISTFSKLLVDMLTVTKILFSGKINFIQWNCLQDLILIYCPVMSGEYEILL